MRLTKSRQIKTFLLFCLLASSASAQRYNFKHYNQEHGLNNLATERLFQDSAGYLWVGTQNGIFRYDGASFTAFGTADGLPDSSIDGLVETPDGVLWVATNRGLARRRGHRFEPFQFKNKIESTGRFGFASDASGRLYLTARSGLLVSEPAAGGGERYFEPVKSQPPGPAYGLHVSANGEVWFGCGFYVCRLAAGKITRFDAGEGVPSDRWDALLIDREGTVWIRSSKRLLRKARAAGSFEPLAETIPPIGDFASLSAGSDGALFVPTDAGIWEFSNGRWRGIAQEQGLPSNATSAVLEDREGSIWVGLWGAGLARWVGRNEWEGWTRAEGLSGEHVWKMARGRRGDLWVATDNGLNQARRDPFTGNLRWSTWTEKDGLAGNKTRAIAIAPDGAVWTGSSPGGISRIDPRSGRAAKYLLPDGPGNDRIWTLTFDRRGTLWVCTRGGLYFANLPAAKVVFEKQDLPDGDPGETVSTIIEDRQGRLWAAGTRGLARRENGVWRRFTEKDGLPTIATGFVAEDLDGNIWLGYRDRTGVSKITVHGDRLSLQTYNQRSGLRSDQAIFVRVDRRGWVWFGTDRGVDVFMDGQWRHYGQQDGLIWDDCNTDAFFEDDDGSVWIGTSRGLAHFTVRAFAEPLDGPRVEFTRVQIGDHVIGTSGSITEPYRNRVLSAQLSVLTFLAEGDVRCRYRLLGLDDAWIETKQRDIRFPNLPPGKFVLEAVGRSAAGKWTAVPARVAFEILPPWWATWWFRVLISVSAVLIVIQLIRWRTSRLQEEQTRLEAAVEERTRQLRVEQARIEQQNYEIEKLLDEARQANFLKDEFLANMSHEIRTPMHGIIGMLNLTMSTDLTAEQKESLCTVHSCAQSLLGILNDILDFSKIEAGKLEITNAPFRVIDTVREACSTFLASAQEKGIQLSWEMGDEIPEWLESDAGRIRQVLLNLLGNALKFTQVGEVCLSANAVETDSGTVELCFAVRDTGIGIPSESQALIFDAFRQADGSTSRTYGGTGLGLTISSRLVELMGGKLRVESRVGRGSTFHFGVQTRRVIVPGDSISLRDAIEQPAERTLYILLAEDNVVNQRLATALLRRRGHRFVLVNNGRLAVERSQSEQFDLILMDLQMPEMDGWEATRQIRERERGASEHVPIIALTAHAMRHVQQQCLAAGMEAVIVKPFAPAHFYATIEGAARQRLLPRM